MNVRLLRDSLPLLDRLKALMATGQHTQPRDSAVLHYALAVALLYCKLAAEGESPQTPPLLDGVLEAIAEEG